MAAFRKGHVKVIKWLVKHVTQFPADPDCKRFMQTVSDKVCSHRNLWTVGTLSKLTQRPRGGGQQANLCSVKTD